MPTSKTNQNAASLSRGVRRRKRWGWVLIIIVALLISFADRQGWLLVKHPDDLAAYQGVRVKVVRVIDGDTFDVNLPDALNDRKTTRVRLWGLDCPEMPNRDREGEPFAQEATAFAREMLDGRFVILRLEPHRERGTFGRVLAHVEVEGQGSLNLALLIAGLAEADERWSHSLLKRYARAEREAREEGAGMWGE